MNLGYGELRMIHKIMYMSILVDQRGAQRLADRFKVFVKTALLPGGVISSLADTLSFPS